MDIAQIGSLLSSLKTATDIAKLIRESGVTLERAELKLKLAELVEALADAKVDAASVQQVILDRDDTIRQLRAEARIRNELKWVPPCYFLTNAEGVDEPFCQKCYDADSKLSRLHTDGRGFFQCTVCTQKYKTNDRSKADDTQFKELLQRRAPSASTEW